jgi:hypothetical protein
MRTPYYAEHKSRQLIAKGFRRIRRCRFGAANLFG